MSKDRSITCFKEILDKTESFKNPIDSIPNFIFRGQSNKDWKLEPSLTRILNSKKIIKRNEALDFEKQLVNKFAISANHYIPFEKICTLIISDSMSDGIDFIGWFCVMQHYGAPTKLLDWSASVAVATYFACEDFKTDGALWVCNYNKITDYSNAKIQESKKEFVKSSFDTSFSENIVMISKPSFSNERFEAQRCYFTMSTDLLKTHDKELEKANALTKFEIKKEHKKQILSDLYNINVNAKTLFPGIDGLSKSVKEFALLWENQNNL